MAVQHSPAQKNRRRSDREDWEHLVDELAQKLCTAGEWQQYYAAQSKVDTAARASKNMTAFPVWRKYRGRAYRIAQLQRILPFTRKLPLRLNAFLSEILLK